MLFTSQKHFQFLIHLILTTLFEVVTVIVPILQVLKLRHRELK